jgi:type VI secretion system protein VasD
MHGPTLRLTLLLPAILLAACATKPKPVALKAHPSAALNQDETGQSLSLVLRTYQLKTADSFKQVTLDKLASAKDDKELLGNAFLERKEFVLIPGHAQSLEFVLAPEAEFVAVVANSRQPEHHRWRYLFSRDDLLDRKITLTAQDCYLNASGTVLQTLPGQDLGKKPLCAEIKKIAEIPLVAPPANDPIKKKSLKSPKPNAKTDASGSATPNAASAPSHNNR